MPTDKSTDSLTKLLKKHKVGLSAVAANKLLLTKGLLEEKTRPSGSDPSITKKFKVLTELGRNFGENVANALSPNETTPKYYRETFADLAAKYLTNNE